MSEYPKGTDVADLVETRFRMSLQAHRYFTALSMASGKDLSEVLRDVTDKLAVAGIHEASLVMRLTRSEGEQAAK